jgi:ketosteroid isomerase-like protein
MTPPEAKAAALLATPDDTEAQFYEALQQGDVPRLMAAWSDDDEVICVHPGGPRVMGHAAVRKAFESIFANGGVPVHVEGVRRLQTDATAVHNVLERIDVRTAEGVKTAWVVATNVYLKTPMGWRMVAHHASPSTPQDAAAMPADAPKTLH